jgi:hypothetical protein
MQIFSSQILTINADQIISTYNWWKDGYNLNYNSSTYLLNSSGGANISIASKVSNANGTSDFFNITINSNQFPEVSI